MGALRWLRPLLLLAIWVALTDASPTGLASCGDHCPDRRCSGGSAGYKCQVPPPPRLDDGDYSGCDCRTKSGKRCKKRSKRRGSKSRSGSRSRPRSRSRSHSKCHCTCDQVVVVKGKPAPPVIVQQPPSKPVVVLQPVPQPHPIVHLPSLPILKEPPPLVYPAPQPEPIVVHPQPEPIVVHPQPVPTCATACPDQPCSINDLGHPVCTAIIVDRSRPKYRCKGKKKCKKSRCGSSSCSSSSRSRSR